MTAISAGGGASSRKSNDVRGFSMPALGASAGDRCSMNSIRNPFRWLAGACRAGASFGGAG
jgi:hypothetical protein